MMLLLSQALETNWRGKTASLNYIETSTWTRQEHNGYSHQNVSSQSLLPLEITANSSSSSQPGFISSILQLPTNMARVYFP